MEEQPDRTDASNEDSRGVEILGGTEKSPEKEVRRITQRGPVTNEPVKILTDRKHG